MADPISAVANVQLGFLQSPEIARETVPAVTQAQLASAQAPAYIARHDREARETVQQLPEAGSQGVPDALGGNPNGEAPTYGERRRGQRPPCDRPLKRGRPPWPRLIRAGWGRWWTCRPKARDSG